MKTDKPMSDFINDVNSTKWTNCVLLGMDSGRNELAGSIPDKISFHFLDSTFTYGRHDKKNNWLAEVNTIKM